MLIAVNIANKQDRQYIEKHMTRALVEKLKFAEHPDNIWWSFDDKEFSIMTTQEQLYYDRSNVVTCPIGTLRE